MKLMLISGQVRLNQRLALRYRVEKGIRVAPSSAGFRNRKKIPPLFLNFPLSSILPCSEPDLNILI